MPLPQMHPTPANSERIWRISYPADKCEVCPESIAQARPSDLMALSRCHYSRMRGALISPSLYLVYQRASSLPELTHWGSDVSYCTDRRCGSRRWGRPTVPPRGKGPLAGRDRNRVTGNASAARMVSRRSFMAQPPSTLSGHWGALAPGQLVGGLDRQGPSVKSRSTLYWRCAEYIPVIPYGLTQNECS